MGRIKRKRSELNIVLWCESLIFLYAVLMMYFDKSLYSLRSQALIVISHIHIFFSQKVLNGRRSSYGLLKYECIQAYNYFIISVCISLSLVDQKFIKKIFFHRRYRIFVIFSACFFLITHTTYVFRINSRITSSFWAIKRFVQLCNLHGCSHY